MCIVGVYLIFFHNTPGSYDRYVLKRVNSNYYFALLQIIGVWLALRYRNQKDPRANPSAFL